jgi:hypothetical protein
MSYDGVPKNAQGEPQRSPHCVGLNGKRLNRLDCARETGLSTSVVNRQFATLERLGYIQIKKDGSIWYRGKVEPRAETSVRQSVTECLQGPRKRSAAPAQPVLRRLVTARVIPASLLKATQSFPADDQAAVEAHILEVARWERQESPPDRSGAPGSGAALPSRRPARLSLGKRTVAVGSASRRRRVSSTRRNSPRQNPLITALAYRKRHSPVLRQFP